jgi:hypothetical protein
LKINRISPDIYEIEEFVTVEQQEKVLEFAKSLDEQLWWQIEEGQEIKDFFYGKQYNGEKPNVFKKINQNVKNLFSTALYVSDIALQRYKINEAMKEHRDYWLYDKDYHMRYGIAIYYNDEYEGGEISYPELNINHKPKARSLLMHGGNILHGTLPVTSDHTRFFSTTFVKGSSNSPVILNPEIFADVELHDGSIYP